MSVCNELYERESELRELMDRKEKRDHDVLIFEGSAA